jgi:hypothetical protein
MAGHPLGEKAMSETELIEVETRRAMTQSATTTPLQLLSLAVQNGTSMEQLERLMALQERWEANEARKAYTTAFAAFKAEAVTIIKNKSVTDGPLKGKKYAELFAVVNAVTPMLSKHGLSASWRLTKDDKDWLEVTCTLRHVGGHSESVAMGGPPDSGGAKNAIQARASSVSYLERYTLKAVTGLSEQEDDRDGAGSGARGGEEQSAEATELIDIGREKALDGMKALTAWWGGLPEAKRKLLTPEFASLRKAAQQVDKESGNARR